MDPEDARQIEEWLRKLPRRDPLGPFVRALLEGQPVPQEAVDPLLERLEHPERHSWRSVALAAVLAGEADLPEDRREQVLAALRRLVVRRRHRGRARSLVRGVVYGSATAGTAWAMMLGLKGLTAPPLTAGSAITAVLAVLAMVALMEVTVCAPFIIPMAMAAQDRFNALAVTAAAAGALGRQGDTASAGLLAQLCRGGSAALVPSAPKALSRIVPLLTDEHYGVVDPVTVPALCDALLCFAGIRRTAAAWHSPHAGRASLDALERMGDGRAVDAVRQVAEASSSEELRTRAAEVVPVLEARRAHEREARRLLRPADAPEGEGLLRPATVAPDTPAELLLRPAEDGSASQRP